VLWNAIGSRSKKTMKQLEQYLVTAFNTIIKIYNTDNFSSKVIDLRIYDVFTFFSQLLIAAG
jgi:hypothetical protein